MTGAPVYLPLAGTVPKLSVPALEDKGLHAQYGANACQGLYFGSNSYLARWSKDGISTMVAYTRLCFLAYPAAHGNCP